MAVRFLLCFQNSSPAGTGQEIKILCLGRLLYFTVPPAQLKLWQAIKQAWNEESPCPGPPKGKDKPVQDVRSAVVWKCQSTPLEIIKVLKAVQQGPAFLCVGKAGG